MKKLTTSNTKIEFYKYLNGDISVLDIEKFIYHQPNIEQQLNSTIYLELISFDFKDKYINDKLKSFILKHVVDEGQFEIWKLKNILTAFINDFKNIDKYLNDIYHLYFGVFQDNGQRKYEYRFLANLGLNYPFWAEEAYLKTIYGDNWKTEHEKCVADFEFYHDQLKPFAEEILNALNENKIQILNDGTYILTNDLKTKLEKQQTYKLQHH